MESMRSMFSTKRPQVFPQRISFCIEALRGFSTKFSPLVFPLEIIYPGSASSYPLAPPQTRTSAINASGSSDYGFATF